MSSKTTTDDKSDASAHPESTSTSADRTAARPDDCQCWDADQDLPCWPCARDGFETQNPVEPGASSDNEEEEEASWTFRGRGWIHRDSGLITRCGTHVLPESEAPGR